MPTYPGQSGTATQLTVDEMLQQPTLISRTLTALTSKRFVANRIFMRGTSEMVAGGAMRYQRDESIFLGTAAEALGSGATATLPVETGPRGQWLRASWSEQVRTKAIQEFGLEVLITNLSVRFNVRPQFAIAQRKLANNIVKFVDSLAFTLLQTDPDVLTGAASANWTVAGTDIIGDITAAQESIENQNQGYNGFEGATLVLPLTARRWFLENTGLRAALPREAFNGPNQIQTGFMAPMLGLNDILFATQIDSKTGFLIDTSVGGVIADSVPDPQEGFFGDDPGDGQPPIWVKVYKEEPKDTVVAGGRWPAMAIISPKAIYKITGLAP